MVERSQKEVWKLTPWLVLVLLLGNFILMAFSAKDITSGQRLIRVWGLTISDFVQSPVTTVSSGISGYFGSIANLRSAQDENTLLKQQVEELKLKIASNEGLQAENDRLKALLDLKDESKYKVLTARIIGRDPSFWFDSVIINQGSLNGVKLNMPVVANGGLVGRVTAVVPRKSI
jgi:rod shape-determining protein MreC